MVNGLSFLEAEDLTLKYGLKKKEQGENSDLVTLDRKRCSFSLIFSVNPTSEKRF